MLIGDLVRYKNSTFLATRMHEVHYGLVVDIRGPESSFWRDRTVKVRWGSKEDRLRGGWYNPTSLEVIKETNSDYQGS